MLNTIQLCRHLGNIVHVPIRLYEEDGSKVDMGFAEPNQEDPLETDPEFRRKLLQMRDPERPQMVSEGRNTLYAVIPAGGQRTILFGPACYNQDTTEDSRATALLHGIKGSSFYRISCVSLQGIVECILLLFNDYSDTAYDRQDLLLADIASEYSITAGREAYRIVFNHRENSTSHNSYAQERREQKAVREGNPDALRQSWSEVQTGSIGRLGRDPLTHYRNLAVVNITLASRSAIEGGVLPEVAYSLADSYTMRLQDIDDPTEIVRLFRSAELHYTELVMEINRGGSRNIYIQKCKEMVHDRLHEHVYENELAEELGITRSYLSLLFLREEGIHLSEYILREKIRASEHLLMYPEVPLGTVAATFGFSSQSHYGQVFRRFNGISPGKYREQHLTGRK